MVLKPQTSPLFALEYTPQVLRLFSLEQTPQGYQVGHYEQRVLGGNRSHSTSLVQNLQEMRRALGAGTCSVIVGLHDMDLWMQCVALTSPHSHHPYSQCQTYLSEQLSHLKTYSWDAYLIKNHAQALCVAYPLRKIVLLQQLCKYCDLQLHSVEPSICALARASHMLLKLPQALFLLQERATTTLFLAVAGEVYAVRSFNDQTQLAQHINVLNLDPHLTPYIENINALFIVQEITDLDVLAQHCPWPILPIDVLDFIEVGARYSVQAEGLGLLTCAGLALRQYM